ncbi:MAG: HPF/RaiA family ribosome-associated protein [Deltaproteobacteria bacterium]|nr:HPF/RaiA family ribosome-associated protein [Deltaproteobacteria bacterium]
MKIQIHFRGFDGSSALREHIVNRFQTELGRLRSLVRSAVVIVADVNGPRGGSDKRCRVLLLGPEFGRTTAADLSTDPQLAVDAAMARAARGVSRRVERARARERLRAEPAWSM